MTALIVRAVILAVIAAAIAIPVGIFSRPWHGWAVFCIGLVLQQLIHFRHFSRLDRWTRNPVVDPSLEGEGAWDDIFGRLYRHEKDLRSQIEQRDQIITLLRAAAQALTDGVVMLDLQNNIMFCNTTAETQLGLKLDTDLGQSILNLVRQPEFVAYLETLDFSRPLGRLRWCGAWNRWLGLTMSLRVPVIHEGEHAGRRVITIDRGDPYFAELQRLWKARHPAVRPAPPRLVDATRIDADFDIGGQSDGRAGGLPGSGVLGWSPHAQDGAGVFDGADDFVGA